MPSARGFRAFLSSCGIAGWLARGALPDGTAPRIQPSLSIFVAAFWCFSRSCGFRACRCGGRYLTETPPASCKPFFFRCSAVCPSFLRLAAAGSSSWWLLRKPPATTASCLGSARLNRRFFGRPPTGADALGAFAPKLAQRYYLFQIYANLLGLIKVTTALLAGSQEISIFFFW